MVLPMVIHTVKKALCFSFSTMALGRYCASEGQSSEYFLQFWTICIFSHNLLSGTLPLFLILASWNLHSGSRKKTRDVLCEWTAQAFRMFPLRFITEADLGRISAALVQRTHIRLQTQSRLMKIRGLRSDPADRHWAFKALPCREDESKHLV